MASMIYFSVLQTRPVLHEILIAVFVTVTTPVTLMILVRAALFRDRSGRRDAASRHGMRHRLESRCTLDSGASVHHAPRAI